MVEAYSISIYFCYNFFFSGKNYTLSKLRSVIFKGRQRK